MFLGSYQRAKWRLKQLETLSSVSQTEESEECEMTPKRSIKHNRFMVDNYDLSDDDCAIPTPPRLKNFVSGSRSESHVSQIPSKPQRSDITSNSNLSNITPQPCSECIGNRGKSQTTYTRHDRLYNPSYYK